MNVNNLKIKNKHSKNEAVTYVPSPFFFRTFIFIQKVQTQENSMFTLRCNLRILFSLKNDIGLTNVLFVSTKRKNPLKLQLIKPKEINKLQSSRNFRILFITQAFMSLQIFDKLSELLIFNFLTEYPFLYT